MKLVISTHKGVLFDNEIDYFTIKNDDGEFAVMKGHIPVITVITSGYVKAIKENNSEFYVIVNGLLEFKDDVANVLAHEAVYGNTYEEAKARLEEIRKERIEEIKKANADYTLLENDLKKNIKASKAGRL